MRLQMTVQWCLVRGIERQMAALRRGLERVLSLERLSSFSPNELRLVLCGEQSPQWTRDEVLRFTEPKLGYSREHPVFERFVNVLVDLSPEERKAFLQFATGCSSLPPCGLASLHPRLTVVRKVDENSSNPDAMYPSVNTCVHYLKLPEYTSETVLKQRLLAATRERGFHLN